MAKCKQCNVNIPDGLDYCDKCSDNNQSSNDEFYLDNLLKMVVNNRNEDAAIHSEAFLNKVDVDPNPSNAVEALEDRVENPIEMSKNLQFDREEEGGFDENSEDLFSLMQEYTPDDLVPGNNLEEKSLSDNNNNQGGVTYDLDDSALDTDEDLLNLLDMISGQNETKDQNTIDSADDNGQSYNFEISGNNIQDNNDQLEIVTQSIDLENNTPEQNQDNQLYHDDILAIDELLSNSAVSMDETQEKLGNTLNIPDNVGKVFSDVVSAVDSLADIEQNNFTSTPDVQKLNSELNDILENAADKSKNVKKNKKTNLLKKLFKKDNSDEEQTDTETPKVKSKKTTNKKIQKEAKTGKNDKNSENSDADSNSGKTSKRASKSNKKADLKKVSKPKKQKSSLKVIQEFDDLEDGNKKISKAATILIFTCIGALCAFIIIGSNEYSYSLNIKNATANFERKRYTQAYNDIYGIDVKKQDITIYNKIITVMIVNKQLNSYHNYYTIGMYPNALDSLLKGLERYDKYITIAKKLGIKSDLDNVRNQILGELESKFSITEKEAKVLNKNSDQAQYSIEVINATSKN